MSFQPLLKIEPLRRVLYGLARWRVREKLAEIEPYLQPGDRVLDVGTGNGVLCRQLRQRGYDVTPVDVIDQSFVPDVAPVLYDGRRLPFDDGFDVVLLITVLHHTPDPDAVLAEARRVARRIVVVEEVYENAFERSFTYTVDSLFNLEFTGHPRSNRTDAGWRAAFEQLGLRVEGARYSRSLGFLRRVTYHLVRA